MNKNQSLPWDNPRFRNWLAVLRAEKAVVRALSRSLGEIGLKIPQLDILMNIYRHPGISQHDLARRLLVGRSNITMLLPQLEKDGVVLRESDPADRRAMRLSLTPAGEEVLMRALALYTQLIDKVMARSTPAECDFMGDIMRRVADAVKDDE